MLQMASVPSLTPAQQADVLVCLRESIDRLELEFAQLAAEFAASEHFEEAGFNSPLDWIRVNCHLTAKQASDRIAVGRSGVARSKGAVEAGEIGFSHLSVIARTALAVGQAVDEESLLEMAREFSPGKLYYRCQQYRHLL